MPDRTHTFDTQAVASRERATYWREAICESYVTLGCACADEGFGGTIDLLRLPGVGLSRVASAPQLVTRRRTHIAREADEFFLFSVQVRGRGLVVQDDRAAVLEPGDAALYSSSDRYSLRFDETFEQLVVQVPKPVVLENVPGAEDLTAIRLPGSVAGRCLTAMLRDGTEPDEAGIDHLAKAAVELLAADLARLPGARAVDPMAVTWARARAELRRAVREPGIDRATLAGRMGLSVRRLNEVLASRGGSIARDLAEIRLEGARAELLAAGGRARIGQVALRWGFEDQSSFARAYRRRYGHAPSRIAVTADRSKD